MDVVSSATVRRGDVFLVTLNPTRGREIRKTRPCVVVSPDELNTHMGTFIVAPLTSGSHPYPFRVACRFGGKDGHVILDQIRTVDDERLGKRLGALTSATMTKVLGILQAMFAV
ncbi:MAG: type II toxin-antitoxin system PemK/MazF family toxin [Gemmatimonadaceae bacterium]|nr:type II toxin-antitoxin system PemK/MazF family toxin [Gemmatimonadaceae bacterium]